MADPKKSYNDIITWAKGTSNDIIAKKLATPRSISITNNAGTSLASGNFDGSADVTLKLPATVAVDISGNAATATKLGSNAGSGTIPIYFSGGKPVACGSSLAVSITGTAATASKLSTNAGDTYTPVYFSGGVPVAATLSKLPVNPTTVQKNAYPSGAVWIES